MLINKSYKFRLYPIPQQEQELLQHGGNTRFLWNYFIDLNDKTYKETGKFVFKNDLTNLLPKLKKEKEFLALSYSQSLQQVARHFDKALKDFINKTKNFPTRKLKHKQQDSFVIPQGFKIYKNYICLPKIGNIKWIKHQPIKGTPKRIIIKQEGEHWYCLVCCELRIKEKVIELKDEDIVGVDLGLKTYVTLSNADVIDNPKILKKHEKKLKRAQRKLSRRVKGSNNRNKQRKKVARIYKKIANIRKDFQHKNTKSMITKYSGIIIEDLNVKGMMRNHKLAKAIQDCAWYEFRRQLTYKAIWQSKKLLVIGRFEPTSKKCSKCGWIDKDLTLKTRTFKCQSCGLVIDRDLNAAINIKILGKKILWDAQESPSERKGTLEETRGCRASAQCLSKNQEKEVISSACEITMLP